MLNRRELIALAGFSAFAAESEVATILKRIQPPQIPERDFPIIKFGARPGQDATEAIRRAIRAAAEQRGGRVVIPEGVWLTGPIHLKSKVNLHVSRGATLKFSTDPKQYLPAVFTRWEGTECMNYSPFIYAFEQTDIAITGEGTLDGQAGCEAWWPWAGKGHCDLKPGAPNQRADRDALVAMADKGTPVSERQFGEGHYLRPNFIQPYRCTNVLIEGVTIRNSPMWEIHPALCTNVIVRGIKINTHGPNNDGCNPESCRDVLIENCEFDTGDDCIAIKSGRNQDGRRVAVPSENIIIRNCTMKAGHGGVTIGSEISGHCRNVFVEDCVMSSPDLNQALRFKNNAARGGIIEHFRARNIKVGQVGVALEIDLLYEEGSKGAYKPVVRDIAIDGLTCDHAKSPWTLRGFPGAVVEQITLENVTILRADKPPLVDHVEGLKLRNVTVNGKSLS